MCQSQLNYYLASVARGRFFILGGGTDYHIPPMRKNCISYGYNKRFHTIGEQQKEIKYQKNNKIDIHINIYIVKRAKTID